MMALSLIILGAAVTVGLIFLLVVFKRAPEGFEDEQGFQLGPRRMIKAAADQVTAEDIAKAREDFERIFGQTPSRF